MTFKPHRRKFGRQIRGMVEYKIHPIIQRPYLPYPDGGVYLGGGGGGAGLYTGGGGGGAGVYTGGGGGGFGV
jgi:hypothetical protein